MSVNSLLNCQCSFVMDIIASVFFRVKGINPFVKEL